jgi:hypothetical protein
MALNWAMIDADRAPVPLPHEMTITTIQSGVELSLTIPSAVSSDASSSKLKESGKIWMTDQRVRTILAGKPLRSHPSPYQAHLRRPGEVGDPIALHPTAPNHVEQVRAADVRRKLPRARHCAVPRGRLDARDDGGSALQGGSAVWLRPHAGEDPRARDRDSAQQSSGGRRSRRAAYVLALSSRTRLG